MVEVVDGDTLVVDGPGGRTEVRLIGINAPERGECFTGEATAALRSAVDGPVLLVGDVSDLDRFGRSLRYVETADGVDVGARLVEGGFAIARRFPPDVARADDYERLQDVARRDGRGLWAPDACGAPSAPGAALAVEVNADAPGDDNLNLNGEWVRFTNTGATAVDLDGWTVADESASHRYAFRDLVLAPGASVTLFTGCGTDTPTERFWCNEGSAVWNNRGDTVFLRAPDGNIVLAERYDG